MRAFLRTMLAVSIVGSCIGWWLCAVPGWFEKFVFWMMILCVIGVPATVLFGIPFVILDFLFNYHEIQERRRKFDLDEFLSKFDKRTTALGLATPFVWFVFLFVCAAQVPETIGFSLVRSQFETAAAEYEMLQALMPADDYSASQVGRRFGIYQVDMVGIDGRGGIYFRVNTGHDGIGPDQMSYGFAKKPNATGSPFGRKYYDPIHLVGDWYVFRASDDFY